MLSAQALREQTRFAMKLGLSRRRACALMQVGRSCLKFGAKIPLKNAPAIDTIKAVSGQNPHFRGRRIRVMLERQGIELLHI